MGSNYGGAVIDFDFRTVLAELGEDDARLRYGDETPEELERKSRIDAGTIALRHFPWSVNPADAPISFEDASSRDFDHYAYAPVNGKTLLLGRNLGLAQERLVEEGISLSLKRGTTFLFWINDASDSYAFSLFEKGRRVRYFTSGPGLSDDEGAPLAAEGAHEHAYDRITAIVRSMLGDAELFELQLEKFDAL